MIVAALGALYIKASSPKASPCLYVFKYLFSPLMILKQSYSPDSTINKASPLYPSWMMVYFSDVFFSYIALINVYSSW